jgi:hypothetical protein
MAWNQTDIDKLERAIATGARRVRFADREVEYRTLEEMQAILDQAKRAVAGPRQTVRVVRLRGTCRGGW